MNARERVLAAYGNRCAFCQSTTGPFEIDHVLGGGNQHRAQLGHTKLHTWLDHEHQRTGKWPPHYQLLCATCHGTKTRSQSAMPAKRGSTNHNISLPDDLSAQLTLRAADQAFGGSKSSVVETALTAYFSEQLSDTLTTQLLAMLGARMDQMQANMLMALQDNAAPTDDNPALASRVASIDESLQAMKLDLAAMGRSIDRLTGRTATEKKGISKWIR